VLFLPSGHLSSVVSEMKNQMKDVFICDAIRTPVGRYAGALSSVRTDDLAAVPLRALIERSKEVDWSRVDDVVYGCANQAGEDNRNVARMAGLLAGLPVGVPGTTINRLCGSGMDAVGTAARAIRAGAALEKGRFALEITPVTVPKRKGADVIVEHDEHIRSDTTLDALAALGTPFREGGSVTAGNSSGVNDGA